MFEQRHAGKEKVNFLDNWRWDVLGRHSNQCRGPGAPRPQKPSVFERLHGCQLGCRIKNKLDRFHWHLVGL